jgi:hypothetical protein
MSTRICVLLLCLPIFAQNSGSPNQEVQAQAACLRTLIEAAPKLPLRATEVMVQPTNTDWETGMVSWIALDGKGTLYLIQRGEKADPVLVVDLEGHLLRSWGKACTRFRTAFELTRMATSGQWMPHVLCY